MDQTSTSQQFFRYTCLVALLLSPASGLGVDVFTDNFDDGNDDGWTHFGLESIGFPAPGYEFPDDIFGGKAYRIATPAPPVPDAGPGRAFTYLEDFPLSDFFVEVDLLDWDNELNQAFGFLIRAENIALGQTTGYVVNYDPQQESGGRGQFQINRVVGEGSDETIAAGNITLQPGEDYRIIAVGMGSQLQAAIFSLRDLTEPIVEIFAEDGAFSSGSFGLFNFSRVDSDEYTNSEVGRADTTFDNFRLNDDPLAALDAFWGLFIGAGRPSVPGQPMFLGKFPLALGGHEAASVGITFDVIPTAGNPIDQQSARLILNGSDVSADVNWNMEAGLLTGFYSNLKANMLYHVYAEVAGVNGQTSSMEWSLHTFETATIESDEVVVIEAEDYNYENGQYQNDPPVSGFPFASFNPVRGNGIGYLDLIGAPGVDYFDYSDQTGSGVVPEYRLEDHVGTQAGSLEIESNTLLFTNIINDFIRPKYFEDDLPEFQVHRTEGGEWLNYTRDFPEGNYLVYLRSASRAEQSILLDRVTSSAAIENQTTEAVGRFNLPNDGLNVRYRFTPLVDENGQQLIVPMSGQETVRLTIGGEREDRTKYTVALNYLLFMPVEEGPAFQLFSAEELNGDFTPMAEAALDAAAGTFTVPISGVQKYFRIQGAAATRIEGVRIENGSLILNFANE